MKLHSMAAARCAGLSLAAIGATMAPVAASPQNGTVRIARDTFGVPNIIATTDEAAYYGAGRAIAEDRLYQMYLAKAVVRGRTSRTFGPGVDDKNRKVDRNSRLMGWGRYCDEANGVPLGQAEQLIVDDLFAHNDIVDDNVGVVQESDVDPSLLQAMRDYAGGANPYSRKLRTDPTVTDVGVGGPKFRNAMAIGRVHTGTGTPTPYPILMTDPRVPVAIPSIFYKMHMVSPNFNVWGAAVPGSPNIPFGSTPDNAWTVTSLGLDQADLFKLNVDKSGSTWTYELDGAFLPMEENQEVVQVAGSSPDVYVHRRTVFGPVVTELSYDQSGATVDLDTQVSIKINGCNPTVFMQPPAANEEYALRAIPFARPDVYTERGFYDMYVVKSPDDISDFREALAGLSFPSINMVFANSGGGVGYVAVGSHPVRHPSQFLTGFAAQDGTKSYANWDVLLEHDYKPWVINPADGYVISGNHMPAGSWYPLPRLSSVAGDSRRALRTRQLVEGEIAIGDGITEAEVLAIHNDIIDPMTKHLVQVALDMQAEPGISLTGKALVALAHLRDNSSG